MALARRIVEPGLVHCRQAMNLEEVDGLFAALIAGPQVVPPSEYLPEVFGGEMSDTCEFAGGSSPITSLSFFKSASEVRVLSSTGITRLQRPTHPDSVERLYQQCLSGTSVAGWLAGDRFK